MNELLAVPSTAPGGLAAPVSAHFGRCDVFTLIELKDGQIDNTRTVTAPDHAAGGCLAPVAVLANAGVTAVAAGGMGRRPLMGFVQSGIRPYRAAGYTTVSEVARAFAAGQLRPFGTDAACAGGNAC